MRNSLTDFAIVVILAVGVVLAFRREDEGADSGWEARWHELSPADRSRIARAARSGTLLADPEEIELAADIARRYRRRLFTANLAAIVSGVAGVALIAAGVAADSVVFVIGGGAFLLRGLWWLRQDLQIGRNLREAIGRDHRP